MTVRDASHDNLKRWLTANGIDIYRVPEDATIYVKDERLWYEEFQFEDNGQLRKDRYGVPKRTTKWVFHNVGIGDID